MTEQLIPDAPSPTGKPRTLIGAKMLLLASGCLIALCFFHGRLQNYVSESATLSNDAPPPELVDEMIQNSREPRSALLMAWNSGKVVHRESAIRNLQHLFRNDEPLPPQFNALLVSAALDADANVRENALQIMEDRHHPDLAALAVEQLRDEDEQVRLLGLNHLKSFAPAAGVPVVIPLLDDADPLIVMTGLKLLEKWSGEKFGARLSQTVAVADEKTGLEQYDNKSYAKAKAGALLAKDWWSHHQSEFPPVRLQLPAEATSARQTIPCADFKLRTLDGTTVHLSDFRGKVVLLNFWTTWCTACVSEIPELVALQQEHKGKLAIIGVSLDYVPDEDGHLGGEAAVEEQGYADAAPGSNETGPAAFKRIREKIARTVKARGINYPILLDEQNEVGGRFNGGELPTTVIVDARGNIRRRFVGARSLPVFEAMIVEASSIN